jgi:DoxX-like protein
MATVTAQTAAPARKWQLGTSYVLSAIPICMLLFSASLKIVQPPMVVQQFTGMFGYPARLLVPLAIIELSCALLYAIPRTAVLGAILLTGYLGGAIATHVRVVDPGFATGLVLGILTWVGLYVRDARLRALLPLRQP